INDKAAPGSTVNKTLDSELFDKAKREYSYTNKRKIELKGVFTAGIGQPPVLEVRDGEGNYVKAVSDEVVQKAERQAVTQQKVLEQLNKTGDTPYSFEELEVNIDPDSFLSIKSINNLRRNVLEQLSSKRVEIADRDKGLDIKKAMKPYLPQLKVRQKASDTEIIAGVRNIEGAEAAISAGADTIYILGDYNYKDNQRLIEAAADLCKQKGCSLYYVLPQITRNHEVKLIEAILKDALGKWADIGIVISNIGHLPLAKGLGVRNIRGNFSLNITNAASANHLEAEGLGSISTSPELSLSQIKDLALRSTAALEGLVYGYLPVMVTEYCPNSTTAECSSCRRQGFRDYGIVDERDKSFKVINMGNCRNLILNSDVLCVFDNLSSIIDSGTSKLRLDFYVENNKEIFDIIEAYKNKLDNLTGALEYDIINSIKEKGFTKGHYFRGID
ncbi:MAG: peptidase, partial [Clostridia bacterium]|nr:peptidase [Clostridia bacterium]